MKLTLTKKLFPPSDQSKQDALDEFVDMRRRVKGIFIGQEDLLRILCKDAYLSGMPEDVVVLGVNHDPMRRGFIMSICSMDFPVVVEGAVIELIEVFQVEIVKPDEWSIR